VTKKKTQIQVPLQSQNTEEAQFIFTALISSLQSNCDCSTCQIMRPLAKKMFDRFTSQTIAELKGKEGT